MRERSVMPLHQHPAQPRVELGDGDSGEQRILATLHIDLQHQPVHRERAQKGDQRETPCGLLTLRIHTGADPIDLQRHRSLVQPGGEAAEHDHGAAIHFDAFDEVWVGVEAEEDVGVEAVDEWFDGAVVVVRHAAEVDDDHHAIASAAIRSRTSRARASAASSRS